MTNRSKTDRFDRLGRKIGFLAFACILLPTLLLTILVLYTYMRSQRFAGELAEDFVPYGLTLVKSRIQDRYESESKTLLGRFFERKSTRSLNKMDLTFVVDEPMGLSKTVFQYSAKTGLIASIPSEAEKLQSALAPQLSPDKIDNELHYLDIELMGDDFMLPYVYIFDARLDEYFILGFVPEEEYIHKELFPNLLHTDIFASQDIFQGELLEKYFAFVTKYHDTPIATTHMDYAGDPLATTQLRSFLPGYELDIHYRDVEFQILEGLSPNIVWSLLILLFVVFIIGFYSFLKSALQEIRLSRAKSHFISNVSHEFKTPLGLIRLYNETLELQRYRDEDEKKSFHKTITRETVRLSNMINRLLSFSRMETGQKQYNFQMASLPQIMEDVLDSYGRQIEDAGFEIEADISHDIEPLPLDKESISQAVINLLDNAQKYSGDRKTIYVKLGENSEGPFIEIADEGIGIPEEDIKRIFEMFYRVEDGLVHDVKGLGIGLAVVKKIIEDHKGSIDVRSGPGEGSVFTLLFRRDKPRGNE